MNGNEQMKTVQPVKWLQYLFYIGIATLVNPLVSVIPGVPASVTTWTGRVIMAATIVCTYQLSGVNKRYRKSAIYWAIALGCMLLPVVAAVAAIFSLMAVYQEYNAHAELVAEKDPALSGRWSSLFFWGLAVGLLMGFGSIAGTLLAVGLEMEAASAATWIIAALTLPQLVLDLVYLRCLNRTICLMKGDVLSLPGEVKDGIG